MTEVIREQENCYLTTPEHQSSFWGRYVYVYTAMGSLQLTTEFLTFKSKKTSFKIDLKSINDISIGHYSRLAKPFRLDYISITYKPDSKKKTKFLTPAGSWAASTWSTNKVVADWKSTLEKTVQSARL